jgi:hypothetical protein
MRRTEVREARSRRNTKDTVTLGFNGAFGDISVVTTLLPRI